MSNLYSAQPVNSTHHTFPHITNVHTTVEHCTSESTKWMSNGDIMYSCGPTYIYIYIYTHTHIYVVTLMTLLVQCQGARLNSIYHSTSTLCDTPYMTSTATCFDTEVPSSGSYHSNATINITIYVPLLHIWCWYMSQTAYRTVRVLDDILTVRTDTVWIT